MWKNGKLEREREREREMGKKSKWIRNLLTGKNDREKQREKSTIGDQPVPHGPTTPILVPSTTPKEKRRWSFRRSSTVTGQKDLNGTDCIATAPPAAQVVLESQNEESQNAKAVVAADAALISLNAAATGGSSATQEVAAIKIQSVFRSYLARRALSALKGLVKLQALVRGHLVRKQATVTLRCMQALVTAQARALTQRIRVAEGSNPNYLRQLNHRHPILDSRCRHTYEEMETGMEKNIKIVQIDLGESKGSTKNRNSYSNHAQTDQSEHRFSTHSAPNRDPSPAPSAVTDMSPRTYSGHFEDYCSAQYTMFPNYMANTESSRAKARSQSAPKARPDSFEIQPSRRRASLDGRNMPRAVRMQRSSSHVGSSGQNCQFPWPTDQAW